MSDSVLHIGNKIDETTVRGVSSALTDILRVSAETRASEAVTIEAIQVLSRYLKTSNVSVSGCTFLSETRANEDTTEEPLYKL